MKTACRVVQEEAYRALKFPEDDPTNPDANCIAKGDVDNPLMQYEKLEYAAGT